MAYQVNGSRVEWNPAAARLRELAEEMPNASVTEFGNVAVKARVDSRSTRSTYLVEDSANSRGQTITRAEYDRVAAIQDTYIAKSHMVVVDGYIGSDPQFRTRARLIMEAANANVAGMNTGRVGGGDDHPGSKKVTIPCSSAIVQGIVEGTIEWAEDPDFGYEVAVAIPGADDIEILQPRRLDARQGRMDEHEAMAARLKREPREFLNSFPGLDESLVKSLG